MSNFLKWGFNGSVTPFHSEKTVELQRSKDEPIQFAELVETKVPTFNSKSRFRLKPFLFSGSLQALYSSSIDQQLMYKVWYGREILTYKQSEKYPHLDDGDATLDYVVKLDTDEEEFKLKYEETLPTGYPKLHPRTRFMSQDETGELHHDWATNGKPIVVIIHGLLGGSHEYHIRGTAELLSQNGFNVVVLNSRGCCRSKVTTPHIFTALATDDVRFYIDKLSAEYPNTKLHCIAFSYGSSLLANYLGEEGANCKLTSALVLGCPWDLIESGFAIHESYLGAKIFAPMLTKYLVNFIKIHKDILSTNKELDIEGRLSKLRAEKFDKIWQFDNLFTAPLHGFQTLSEYYRRASPVNRILDIGTPTLILNSTDDPVISGRLPILDIQLNPYLYLAQTDIGGHFNYIKWDNSLWFIDGVVEYFKAFGDVEERQTDYEHSTNVYNHKIGRW